MISDMRSWNDCWVNRTYICAPVAAQRSTLCIVVWYSTVVARYSTVVVWYMNLADPTMEQSGLVSVVVGAGAAWFGLYAGTSKKKD